MPQNHWQHENIGFHFFVLHKGVLLTLLYQPLLTRKVVLKACLRSHHPFGASLSEDEDVPARFLPDGQQPATQVCEAREQLLERDPRVLPQDHLPTVDHLFVK